MDAELQLAEEIRPQALSLIERARSIEVRDQQTYNQAAELEKTIHALRQKVKARFEPIIDQAHKTHKEALAGRDAEDKPLEQAESLVKRCRVMFEAEQAMARLGHQRQLEKQANEQQQEQRLAEAIAAEQAGANNTEVAAMLDAPLPPMAVIARPTFERAAGLGSRENWKAEVTDIRALCRAVAEGSAPEHFVEANLTPLNLKARAEKQAMNVPGVRAVMERVGVTRSV